MLEPLEGEGAAWEVEVGAGGDFGGGVGGSEFLEGSVDEVLDGEVGVVPDDSVVVAHMEEIIYKR